MTSFNVKTVKLEGSNLIEASAGTGKTWSVAILVVRLIVEKEIPIEKILMVTFTKAAVAELESRIRSFVRKAYKHARNEELDDSGIAAIVGEPDARKLDLLKKAVQSLDRLSVMTIHSFCQEMIGNYPFESGQSFESEIMTDSSGLVEYYVNEAWRREINTLEDKAVFKHIVKTISRQDLSDVVTRVLGDRTYLYEPIDVAKNQHELKIQIEEYEKKKKDFEEHIQNNWNEITSREYRSHASNFISKNNTPQLFINEFFGRISKNDIPTYFGVYFQSELAMAEDACTVQEGLSELTHQFKADFYGGVVETIKQQVENNKEQRNIITFDDLISSIHKAVEKGTINQVALNKFDAVFIDEFQDTDKKQYEIFDTLFAGKDKKILFYIGDPKQSIYGWRKADIATYKKARNKVDTIHTMNNNFRSTARVIDALNTFFGINDPFYDQDIQYQKVGKGKIDLGEFTENGQPVFPLSINSFKKNAQIVEYVKTEILRLLTSPNVLIGNSSVIPSDIAVLVRSHNQSAKVKEALTSAGIPSVTVDDSSVFLSEEAIWIKNLLETILQPRRNNMNKLLLNPRFGFNRLKIESLNVDEQLELFRKLKNEWKKNGIYNMMFSFFSAYNVIENCMKMGLSGQRSLSNFLQLAELLHQREQKTKFSPEEMITWLSRQKDNSADEYEQRIESEDDAVKITTIHKAKGLTYKVVFAPFLDLIVNEDFPPFDFRDSEGYKFTHSLTEEHRKLWRDQQEQENRRLLYVALTRAQYKTYICENLYHKSSSLKPFLLTQSNLFEVDVEKEAPKPAFEKREVGKKFTPKKLKISYEDIKPTFGIHSFSSLNELHHSTPFLEVEQADPYEKFIFEQLPRGATPGNALHSIFERLQFDKPDTWLATLEKAAGYYPKLITDEQLPYFKQMVENTMNLSLALNGEVVQLKNITQDKMLPELKFHFSIKIQVHKPLIKKMLGDDIHLPGDASLQGLMNGFIDLIFEHNNKFYILDWKSNYLGNSLDDYTPEALKKAMIASNYTLQYMIYTIAVKRWLQSRMPDFDYEKHFGGVIYLYLRGVRQGKDTGVYTSKPAKEMIDKLEEVML